MNLLINIILFIVSGLFFYLFLFFIIKGIYFGRKKSEFRCMKCGKCCSIYTVRPNDEDIRRIESVGFDRDKFMDKNYLKKINGHCVFLKRRGSDYICSIHKIKPKQCRNWPFCKVFGITLADTRYSCPGLERINKMKFL